MVVFGGAVGGGGLADDNLYALDLKNGEDVACWLVYYLILSKSKFPSSEIPQAAGMGIAWYL